MINRDLLTLTPRLAYGLAEGFRRYYVRPAIEDLASFVTQRFIGPIDMDEVNAHISSVVQEESEFKEAA